jgi:hypothetical protein
MRWNASCNGHLVLALLDRECLCFVAVLFVNLKCLLNGIFLSYMKVLDCVIFNANIYSSSYSVCWKMYFLHW